MGSVCIEIDICVDVLRLTLGSFLPKVLFIFKRNHSKNKRICFVQDIRSSVSHDNLSALAFHGTFFIFKTALKYFTHFTLPATTIPDNMKAHQRESAVNMFSFEASVIYTLGVDT